MAVPVPVEGTADDLAWTAPAASEPDWASKAEWEDDANSRNPRDPIPLAVWRELDTGNADGEGELLVEPLIF